MHHNRTGAYYLVLRCTVRKVAAILAALLCASSVGAMLPSMCCRYSVWGLGGSQGWRTFMLIKPSVLTSDTCGAKSDAFAVMWREPLVNPAISSGPTITACRASKTVVRFAVRDHCMTDLSHVCCPVECCSDQMAEVYRALNKLHSTEDRGAWLVNKR